MARKKKTLRERAFEWMRKTRSDRQGVGYEADAYIAGHRSRDREVRELKALLREVLDESTHDDDSDVWDDIQLRIDETLK